MMTKKDKEKAIALTVVGLVVVVILLLWSHNSAPALPAFPGGPSLNAPGFTPAANQPYNVQPYGGTSNVYGNQYGYTLTPIGPQTGVCGC